MAQCLNVRPQAIGGLKNIDYLNIKWYYKFEAFCFMSTDEQAEHSAHTDKE